MMMRASSSLLVLSSLLSLVSAHGYVSEMIIGGKTYHGNNPYTMSPKNSPLRKIDAVEPVKIGQDDHNLVCGKNAEVATDVAEVAAGEEIKLKWVSGDGSKWIHDKGPVTTYMASCGDVPCNEFDASQARWFKVEEKGVTDENARTWYQTKIFNGELATTRIPSDLVAGNYLLRHELIALHLATFVGGAEFYINCAQLKVTGNGSKKPSESDLVNIPGLYRADEDGLVYPIDMYPMVPYTFPGPNVAKLVSGGSSEPSGGDSKPAPTDDGDSKPDGDSQPKPPAKPPVLSPGTPSGSNGETPSQGPKPGRSCASKRKARREAARKRALVDLAAKAANETSPKVPVAAHGHHNAVRRRMHGGASRF